MNYLGKNITFGERQKNNPPAMASIRFALLQEKVLIAVAWIPLILLHFYTTYMGYDFMNIVGALLAFMLPGLSEIAVSMVVFFRDGFSLYHVAFIISFAIWFPAMFYCNRQKDTRMEKIENKKYLPNRREEY